MSTSLTSLSPQPCLSGRRINAEEIHLLHALQPSSEANGKCQICTQKHTPTLAYSHMPVDTHIHACFFLCVSWVRTHSWNVYIRNLDTIHRHGLVWKRQAVRICEMKTLFWRFTPEGGEGSTSSLCCTCKTQNLFSLVDYIHTSCITAVRQLYCLKTGFIFRTLDNECLLCILSYWTHVTGLWQWTHRHQYIQPPNDPRFG